jgi:hypothetical protein
LWAVWENRYGPGTKRSCLRGRRLRGARGRVHDRELQQDLQRENQGEAKESMVTANKREGLIGLYVGFFSHGRARKVQSCLAQLLRPKKIRKWMDRIGF